MQGEPAFWDTSAIVPLCCLQDFTLAARNARRRFSLSVVWWATPVEVHSSIDRLLREQALTVDDAQKATSDWEKLNARAGRIMPDDDLLKLAIAMPRMYSLRAADSLQLAAALVWCGERSRNRPFVCADKKLSIAAEDAGFDVVELV